jgi:hypothetical protein
MRYRICLLPDGTINSEREYIEGTIISEETNTPAVDQTGAEYLDMLGNPIVPRGQKCNN